MLTNLVNLCQRSNNGNVNPNSTRTRLQVELLEKRELMAANWTVNDGLLTVDADVAGSDVHIVDTNPALTNSLLMLSMDGAPAVFIPKPKVKHIRFNGSDQADYFENQTNIRSEAFGNGSNDILINAGCAPAVLVGGAGNDILVGGCGSDLILGGDGHDYMHGNGGNDILDGNSGNDTMYGHAGADYFEGGAGHDLMVGGNDNDQMYGEAGEDSMHGGTGNDIIEGGNDNDSVYGNSGLDIVIGGLGADTVEGGAGEDVVIGGYVTFSPMSAALTSIAEEWTSTHGLPFRRRNIMGYNNPHFDQRLNGNHFFIEGVTLRDDGAIDQMFGDFADGDADLLFVEQGIDVWFLGLGDADI